jgi:hypothetical protein
MKLSSVRAPRLSICTDARGATELPITEPVDLGNLGDDVDRLAALVVDRALDDLRLRDGELELPGARSDQHRSAARRGRDLERVGRLAARCDRRVIERFAARAVADLAAGDVLAFLPGEHGVFTEKHDTVGGSIAIRAVPRVVGRADRVADLDRVDAGDDRDLACGRDVALDPLEALRREQLGHAERLRLAGLGNPHDRGAAPERAALDPADHEPADELVPSQGHRLELQRAVHVDLGRWRLLEDHVEQRTKVLALSVRLERGRACFAEVNDREVELVVVAPSPRAGEHHVHDLVRAAPGGRSCSRPRSGAGLGERLPSTKRVWA